LLTVGYSGTIRIWDLATREVVFATRLPHLLYAACYTADGKRIVVVGNSNKAAVLKLPDAAL
jgi:hypothetical protein